MTEQITNKLTEHGVEIKHAKDRISKLENDTKSIHDLALSVNNLANTMQQMLKEQQSQGVRLTRLENEPVEAFKHYKRAIVSNIIYVVVGGILGGLLSLLFR